MKLQLKNFLKDLKKELDIDFNLTTKEIFLNNKKWDSLLNMSLLSYIDKKYNIVFNYDDLRKFNTIEKIYNELLKKSEI
jgi:acyl carrier protein